ncbi:MAG: hypothetical protein EHM36_08235 [Deltaproteobacteria bacterium]|nr:MAG: hypothetical protein EHM36_08235 [Deltaproteobacteria bacterium]
MKTEQNFILIVGVIVLGIVLAGCHPRVDTMAKAEKIFIKMVDKAAGKLDLNGDQMAKLEQLKVDIRKNFAEGQREKKEALTRIKEEGLRENPDIPKMTAILQESLRAETGRVNKAFDLMLDYQKNLNENQKKRLGQMISEWVGKWKQT